MREVQEVDGGLGARTPADLDAPFAFVTDPAANMVATAEREREQALMDRLHQTLLGFGHGMAFVGWQVRFDGDGWCWPCCCSTSSRCGPSS